MFLRNRYRRRWSERQHPAWRVFLVVGLVIFAIGIVGNLLAPIFGRASSGKLATLIDLGIPGGIVLLVTALVSWIRLRRRAARAARASADERATP